MNRVIKNVSLKEETFLISRDITFSKEGFCSKQVVVTLENHKGYAE